MGKTQFITCPVDDIETVVDSSTLTRANNTLGWSAWGSPKKIYDELSKLIDKYKPNEIIINSPIHKQKSRLKSYSIAAEVMKDINQR